MTDWTRVTYEQVLGASMAASAAVDAEQKLAARLLLQQLRDLAVKHPELKGVGFEADWAYDKGWYMESAGVFALDADSDAEAADAVMDIQPWSAAATRLAFGVSDDDDGGQMTRDELLAVSAND